MISSTISATHWVAWGVSLGTRHPEQVHGPPPFVFVGGGHSCSLRPSSKRAIDDVVVDVGDIGDEAHIESAKREPTSRDVPDERVATVTEVGQVVRRWDRTRTSRDAPDHAVRGLGSRRARNHRGESLF